MRKKITSLKTLLVAAALCVGGSSAWAEVVLTPTQTTELKTTGNTTAEEDNGRSTTVYYNANATSWVTSYVSISNGAFKNQLSNYDGSYFMITKFDASSVLSDKTLVSATLKFNSVCTVSGKNSVVKVALIGTGWDATTATWNNTNTAEIMSSPTEIYSSASVGTTKTLLSVDVKNQLEADADKVIGFAIYTGTAREQKITDLQLVIEAVDASSATTYTIEKYEVGGGLISFQSGIDGIVNNTASAESAEATFYAADGSKKYVFDSENANNVVSKVLVANAEENILKLYFNSYDKYTATVSSICGENAVADITGSWYADEDPVTLYWPKVVSCLDGYYIVDAEESAPSYGYTFSTSNLTKTVTYTLDEDIVYYAEYENILTNKNNYEYFPSQSSKGTSRCIQKTGVMKTAMGLTSDGVYDIVFACGNRDANHTATLELKLIASDNTISTANVINAIFTSSEWKGELTASQVTIPAGSELYLANDNGEGNARIAGDYILVKKSYVSATIGTTGYTTFASPYALDLGNMTGATAYYASAASATAVTLTSTDATVAAGEGLILYGEPKATVTIPTAATGTAIEGNLLVGCPTATEITSATAGYANFYVLSADAAEFQNLEDYVAGGGTVNIPAGKAYLNAAATGNAKLRVIVEGEDATAISAIAAESVVNDGIIYNLNGQRVVKPLKGIYIQNGKKILVK